VNLQFLARGLLVTLELSLIACVLGALLGAVVGIYRSQALGVWRWPATLYVDALRNTPMLVLVFFMRFGPPAAGIPMEPFIAAVVALTIYNSAFLAEIFRAGTQSVPRGQWDAAAASGLGRVRIYLQIILPQAVRNMLPALVGQLVVVVKSTALVSTINVMELTQSGTIIFVRYSNPLETFALLAMIYFVVNSALTQSGALLERRWRAAGIAPAE
jgi:His/Glu/Gln/Arg/opine family amino acid ABC transporter permease subunit